MIARAATRLRSLVVLSAAAVLPLPGCGGGASTSEGHTEHPPRVIVIEEVIPTCPDERVAPEGTPPIEAQPETRDPQTVGLWRMRCPPGEPMPGGHYGLPTFVYDGVHVTLVAPDTVEHIPDPPVYNATGDLPYRLESRWDGDELRVRLPSERWHLLGRFEDGRFVRVLEAESLEYVRTNPPAPAYYERMLLEPRAPHDYLTTARDAPRAEAASAAMGRAVGACAPPGVELRGGIAITFGTDGCQTGEPRIEPAGGDFARCVSAALADLHLADSLSPATTYELRFIVEAGDATRQ